eukprot:TRINITY_DN111103_c0_g1_i1.p1 TRINITY_DN111103_c0_g1~~TRINITY_DN111103_c0_g1_i1.p1  ORF type:complete len:143 (-),score=36.10 TRINITY_DN111103_c0_g1_i1:18-446(-)
MELQVFDASSASDPPGKLPHWASNLENNVDKQLLIMLRDGRKLLGWLRTTDQFANLLVEHVVERHIILEEQVYADIYLGTMLIRGENVCLFGEVDPEQPDGHLQEAPLSYVLKREAELELEASDDGKGKGKLMDLFADQAEG